MPLIIKNPLFMTMLYSKPCSTINCLNLTINSDSANSFFDLFKAPSILLFAMHYFDYTKNE